MQVGAQIHIPSLKRRGLNRVMLEDGCVIHENGQFLANHCTGTLDQFDGRARVLKIGFRNQRIHSESPRLLRSLLGGLNRFAAMHNHVESSPGQRQNDLPPQPPGPSRNQCRA